MKTTAIICTNAALILIGLMTCPKLVATIGMMIAIIIMVACCFAPFFITHPACADDTPTNSFASRKRELLDARGKTWITNGIPKDNLPSQPAKPENHNSAS